MAEYERALISERTFAGLASARARGRKGGRPDKMTAAKLRLAIASMGQPDEEVGISRQKLYRHVSSAEKSDLTGRNSLEHNSVSAGCVLPGFMGDPCGIVFGEAEQGRSRLRCRGRTYTRGPVVSFRPPPVGRVLIELSAGASIPV